MVVFDCEALRQLDDRVEEHNFRCACASFDRLGPDGRPLDEPELLETTAPAELWGRITGYTRTAHRTVAFAHNLGYDLRLSGALELLAGWGWDCKGIALTDYSAWARYSLGAHRLWLCDSLSWLPCSIERVAAVLGRRKRRLPADDAPIDDWLVRCRNDVAVTREALLRLIAWLHDDDLGDFRLTGAAQASAAFRHRFVEPRTLLVHDNLDALEAERRAAWAGRAEVWRHGRIDEPVIEYDFDSAYARVALECELPARLIGETAGLSWRRWEQLNESRALLSEAVVEQAEPILPTEYEGRIVWPVGRFATTAWDCELRLAASLGADVEVGRTWVYLRAPVLRSWASWIIAGLAGEPPGDDELVRVVLKEWSRSLIGRFGLRYSTLAELYRDDVSRFDLYPVRDGDTGEDVTYLQLGRQLFEQAGRVESGSSLPQLMGSIMAEARCRLWAAMGHAGWDSILYVDTDGLLVDGDGARRLERAIGLGLVPGLRAKAAWRFAELRAPRNLDLGPTRRVSGVPRKAERLAPGRYRGEVWESLPAALRRGRPSRVLVFERTFAVGEADPRRRHLDNGRTAAIELAPEPVFAPEPL